MKIIEVDNFNRESISDSLIASNLTEEEAERFVTELNERYSGESAWYFYKSVSNEYKLYVFDPNN